MVQKQVWYFLRIGLLCVFAFSLVWAFVPMAFNAVHASRARSALVGPKAYYLALGDSLAFGYQPDLDWVDGYSNSFFGNLKKHGVQHYDNLACTGESSATMIKGGCPYSLLHKYLYSGPQLQEAVSYLHTHAGQVSPVTLDIGANDLLPDFNATKCTLGAKLQSDLAQVNSDLKNVILPQLVAAMTVNGQMTGDLLLLNYYDPYQSACPNTVQYIQVLNQNLADDASGLATPVDVFSSFGQTGSSASSICTYTWMCSTFKDIHPNRAGYSLIASAIERTVNY